MTNLALTNSRLVHGSVDSLKKLDLKLNSNAGLIYPSSKSTCLEELSSNELPSQLVLIDGTWPQAKNMVRDLPQLHGLSHFRLAPTQPGNYRIRREPTEQSLSTVEATVMALKAIEPSLGGLERLIFAFESMVDQQLNHPSAEGHYCGPPKSGRTLNIPSKLFQAPEKIVIAYGEAEYRPRVRHKQTPDLLRHPVAWVAERLIPSASFSGTAKINNTFQALIEPRFELTPSFLAHLELEKSQFDKAISQYEFRDRWNDFLNVDDLLIVLHQGNLELLRSVNARFGDSIWLKSINILDKGSLQSLGDFFAANRIEPENRLPDLGRAGTRLADTVALTKFLLATNSSS